MTHLDHHAPNASRASANEQSLPWRKVGFAKKAKVRSDSYQRDCGHRAVGDVLRDGIDPIGVDGDRFGE
jgi:hypothetical protein